MATPKDEKKILRGDLAQIRASIQQQAKTVESHKKEIVDQQERLDMYTKSHDGPSSMMGHLANKRVSLKRNYDGSPVKRKNSMSGEDQGSAKRQSTSAGPEATGDGNFTSTHGSD
ncbi:uncharacterized protein FPRN_13521 [Fusarium proliferatum]|nr:uncharacterized protein FPRN_13521 [Fusarium proliferatum]